jgi:hypothetical protein
MIVVMNQSKGGKVRTTLNIGGFFTYMFEDG